MKTRNLLFLTALGTAALGGTVSAQAIDPKYIDIDFSKSPEGLGPSFTFRNL